MAKVEMTFLEHLDELRRRIIISAIAIAIGTCISLYLNRYVVTILKLPFNLQIGNLLASAIEMTVSSERLQGSTMGFLVLFLRSKTTNINVELFKEGPLEGIMAFLGISLTFGILLSSPIVLYQIWAFITPALTRTEKRYAIPLFFIILIFFISGALFAYFIAAPVVLQFSANLFPGLENRWMLSRHVKFMLQVMLGFGVGFELPIVMAFLARINVINADGFREKRRYAIVLIFIAAAILTPSTDALSMLLMAVPLLCLYQLGIWFASLVGRQESEDYA
ncbi:twin-arginine translocase subunit TatC [Candidatus Poribacteria bacterium]|nr:twin-arginine translocase subunit TatC [Candidatus Poribacteria bacterium]